MYAQVYTAQPMSRTLPYTKSNHVCQLCQYIKMVHTWWLHVYGSWKQGVGTSAWFEKTNTTFNKVVCEWVLLLFECVGKQRNPFINLRENNLCIFQLDLKICRMDAEWMQILVKSPMIVRKPVCKISSSKQVACKWTDISRKQTWQIHDLKDGSYVDASIASTSATITQHISRTDLEYS
jgi:hypothetical protein